ncbi:hypothetical protein BDN72DRAFT_834858 [Pluteus cervinus]|uniref:Uncharacterized protein n=1 Tax=Pluteus cervinus TaxID=181527 RepID=A0ACD3B6J0_9AGAR|nr:hypothetical protein BDN72DRAFT_834858 [Pluteus cervinus]
MGDHRPILEQRKWLTFNDVDGLLVNASRDNKSGYHLWGYLTVVLASLASFLVGKVETSTFELR